MPALAGYGGPVGVILGLEGGVRGPLAEKSLTLSVPLPGPHEREQFWAEALGDTPVDDLSALAERFALPGGYIRQAGALAVANAALEGRTAVCVDDARAASRSLNRQLLDTLATHLEEVGGWDDLVVNEMTTARLLELEQRCRYRERLLDHLGADVRSERQSRRARPVQRQQRHRQDARR